MKSFVRISFLLFFLSTSSAFAYLTTANGAVGDGTTDDTINLQAALTYCSTNNVTCEIPAGRTHYVTAPLFMWGNANLTSSYGGGMKFNDINGESFLFNLGISQKPDNTNPPPFTGTISNIVFTVAGGVPNNGYGRILYFWRTQDATITGNTFNYGTYTYGATASGNNFNWLAGPSIRKHMTITNNIINAFASQVASEGFGLVDFKGGTNGEPNLIQGNTITGVGDDPIGIHFSDNVKILSNTVRSTDGRVYVSNSTNIEIGNNKAIRTPSRANGSFYTGIGLIYVGFEDGNPVPGGYTWYSPSSISIHDNQMYFPQGSIDNGAAISLYGVRNASVTNNTIVNDAIINNHFGLILNAVSRVNWYDPSSITPPDTTPGSCTTNCIAKVHGPITIDNNISGVTQGSGAQALRFLMWDVNYPLTCANYVGSVSTTNNSYPGFDGLSFFKGCGGNLTVTDLNNVVTTTTFNDTDSDGYPDMFDNCPSVSNANQADADGNGVGDICQHGLTGAYYSNKTLSGSPAHVTVDSTVDFNWGSGIPSGFSGGQDSFSVRWTGRVVPKYTETYTFYVASDDGERLWVNDRLVVDDYSVHGARERRGTIALTAGVPVTIRLDYFENTGNAVVKLRWESSSQTYQVIPSTQLYAQ